MTDAEELVQYRRENGIAEMALNRPKVLNAMSDDMARELRRALLRLDQDDRADVGILYGNGRAFCSGADVRQRHTRPMEEIAQLRGATARRTKPVDMMFGFANWKPLICAVHGYVVGMAVRLVGLADLTVVDPDTKFQVTETARGISGGGILQLMNALGMGSFGVEVAESGRFWSAQESLDHGLITRISPPGEHLGAARELARQIRENPPLGVRDTVRIRRIVLQRVEVDHASLGARDLHQSADFQERAHAFVQKREPRNWSGG